MKPNTLTPISFEQLAPTSTTDGKTATVPAGCSAVLISVETTDARITFTGVTPDSTHGHVFPKALGPVLVPVGQGATIEAVSTAAAASAVNITYLS